jgi:hypothetical protein
LDDWLCILHAVSDISNILLQALLHDWCHIAQLDISSLVVEFVAETNVLSLLEHPE